MSGLQNLKPTLTCIPHESCYETEPPFPSLSSHDISEVANNSLPSWVICFDDSVVTESLCRLLLPWQHICRRAVGAVFSNTSFSGSVSDGDVSLEVFV